MNSLTVGTSVDPSTTICAPDAATCWAIGLYADGFGLSGKTFEYTDLTPLLVSSVWASWTGGSANGSWAIGKAAVLSFSLAGSWLIQFTNGTISSAIGRLTSNTLWSAWLDGVSSTAGAPPAPSTNAMPYDAATAEAGAVSSEENGPKAR